MNVDHNTLDRFAESLRLRGKQPATVESYCRDAQRFLDYLGKNSVDAERVEAETLLAYQEFLRGGEGEKENSVRRTVIGIRQFYRFLSDARAIKATPFDLVPIPSRDERLPKSLSEEDVETLITVAMSGRPEFKAMRDAAIVSLLAHEGIKANELISLRWRDYLSSRDDEASATQNAGDGAPGQASLRVGGTRARAIFLSRETQSWLDTYRARYDAIMHPVVREATDKRMFIAFKGRDAASPLPEMTRHGLKFILYELGEKAGLKHLNTELLRHFAVNYLIGIGRSPEEIMHHLGLRRMGNISKHLARSKAPRGREAGAVVRVVEGATRG
jgi:integrase/recombinase XerD